MVSLLFLIRSSNAYVSLYEPIYVIILYWFQPIRRNRSQLFLANYHTKTVPLIRDEDIAPFAV